MGLIERTALEKIRLHGSMWWRDEWGTPAKVANEALLAADGEYADPATTQGAVARLAAIRSYLPQITDSRDADAIRALLDGAER